MSKKRETINPDVEKLPRDDVVDLYHNLADAYRQVKGENEDHKQKFHSANLQAKTFASSQIDFQNELETIHANHERQLQAIIKENSTTVEHLKEKNQQLISENACLDSKVSSLSEELIKNESECRELRSQLADIENAPRRVSDSFSRNLELELESLQHLCSETKHKLDEATEQLSEEHSSVEELKERILCLEDNLESKKAEIEEKDETLEGLQEKIQELTVELASLKSAPDGDDRKGNSLFAEVDDQRQKMKKILQDERAHYLEMKKAFNSKEMEIRRLKRENVNIKQEIQTCSNLLSRGDQIVHKSLSDQVKQLQVDNRALEGKLESTQKRLLDLVNEQNLGWIDTVLSTSDNETREFKEKLFAMMVENNSLADNCSKNQKELAKARLECVKFRLLLSRIVEKTNIKINELDYFDIGLSSEVFENLKFEDFEKCDEEESNEESQAIDTELNESTINLLGGRNRLGVYAPVKVQELSEPETVQNVSDDNKENFQDAQDSFQEISSNVIQEIPKVVEETPKVQETLRAIQGTPKVIQEITKTILKVCQASPPIADVEKEKSVKFSSFVQNKVIDATQEQFEESKKARKRPGLVVKRIVIPSKDVRSKEPKSKTSEKV